MAFPDSRETTYAPGSQVKSADLNAIQDRIVGLTPLVFADFTYTADSGTDVLDKTGGNHGLQTGDGPIWTTNSGGGLPGGLAASTDLYAIYVNDDNIKVATSRANALAGVAINITSAGTGTHTIIDQPTTTRVYDKLVRRDLHVAGHISQDGEDTLLLGGGNAVATNGNISRATLASILTTGATALGWTVPLKAGDRPKRVVFAYHGDGAVDITAIAFKIVHQDDSTTSLATGSSSNVPALPTLTVDTLTVGSPVALGATDRLAFELNVSAANLTVTSVGIVYDHPAT